MNILTTSWCLAQHRVAVCVVLVFAFPADHPLFHLPIHTGVPFEAGAATTRHEAGVGRQRPGLPAVAMPIGVGADGLPFP